jgi:hypothetical protein
MYASADFADAEDARPPSLGFDIAGNGLSAPYSGPVNAMLQKHVEEIRRKTTAALDLRSEWRRRLRTFVSQKNTDLLDFLKLTPASHSTLSRGDALLQRFGNPQVHPNHPSVRDFVMDVSGEDVLAEIGTAFEHVRGEGGLKDYARQTEMLFEEYRMAGDAILKAQADLTAKLQRFDRIQTRITAALDLDTNDQYAPLLEATEGYVRKVFEETTIEADYKALIAAYRRFAALRDIVASARSVLAQESEPLCSVCLAETVCFALTPCGHTFCQACCRRQGNSCFMCRSAIKEKVKLYFG